MSTEPFSTYDMDLVPSSPLRVTGLEVTLYDKNPVQHNTMDMLDTPRKRVAVAGPGRVAMDNMRDNMRMSQDKRRMSAMQFKQERYQMEQEMNHLRMQFSSSDRERQAIAVQLREMQLHCQNIKDQFEARDVENSLNETEMADQILQSEKQIEQLKSSNLLLEERMAALRTKQDQEMEKKVAELRSDSQREIKDQYDLLRAKLEREKFEHENELRILRKRLEQLDSSSNSSQNSAEAPAGTTLRNVPSTTTARSQPLASSNGPSGPESMPSRYGRAATRKSRLFGMLQNPGPAVGVVPLQVTQPQSCPSPASLTTDSSMLRTPTPLSPLPHSIPTDSSMLPIPPLPHSKMPASFVATDSLSPDVVSLVVRKTLEQIGVQTVEVTRTHRRSRTNLGRKREEIKKQRTIISDNADKEWKDAIRQFWRKRYNTRTADDFFDYIPASNDLVTACRNSSGVPPDVFQLDFGKGWEKSIWNRTVLRRIYDDILAVRETEGGWGLPDVSEDYLIGLLYMQLKRSREAWSRMQPRFLSDSSRGETSQEAAERVIRQTEQRYHTNSSRSRRQRKYEKRMKIVEEVIVIKTSENAVDLEAWQYFRELLEHLSVDGMSSEEDTVRDVGGQKVTVFLVKLCIWRAEEITEYLKFIDTEAKNPIFRDNRGVRACPRIPVSTPSSLVPPGLPRNIYHSQWLADLESRCPDYVLDELRVSEEAFELLKLAAPS